MLSPRNQNLAKGSINVNIVAQVYWDDTCLELLGVELDLYFLSPEFIPIIAHSVYLPARPPSIAGKNWGCIACVLGLSFFLFLI